MTSADLLVDAFGRIREVVHDVVEGLTPEQLTLRVDRRANTIAWLVWHLTRIQDYHVAVHQQTIGYVEGLGDADLGRIVDEAWDPPVTLGVRLVSVIGDDLQHAGQAAFVRGVARRGELRLRSRRA